MNFDENLKTFVCAIGDDEHFVVEKPITLLCSHAACYSCIETMKLSNGAVDRLKCGLCNKENKIDYEVIAESVFVKHFITLNCSQLFHAVRLKFEKSLKQLKSKVVNMNENVGLQIDYFKDEIDIKVESLKLELEDLRATFFSNLDDFKREFEEYTEKIDTRQYEECLRKLTDSTKRNELNAAKLEEFQNQLKNLNQTIECLNAVKPEIYFKPSSQKLAGEAIGMIDYNFKNFIKKLKDENTIQKAIDLSANPYGICSLPKQNLLVANPIQKNLTLYDSNLNLLKTIDKIDYIRIQPRYLTTDDKNRIYISQSDYHKLTVTDFDFKLVKEIGGKGTSNYQFNYPLGIFHCNNSIYVCDGENKRIQKFTDDLVYQQSFYVDYKPLGIRVINNFACVRSNADDFIYFYSLDPFKLINKISIYGYGAIYSTNFWFYVFDGVTRELSCFDVMGRSLDTCVIDLQFDIDFKEKISFEFYNNNLIFSCRLAKKLISYF